MCVVLRMPDAFCYMRAARMRGFLGTVLVPSPAACDVCETNDVYFRRVLAVGRALTAQSAVCAQGVGFPYSYLKPVMVGQLTLEERRIRIDRYLEKRSRR